MGDDSVVSFGTPEGNQDPLRELIGAGAYRLIEQAVTAELEALLASFSTCKAADGRAGVVRNGYHPQREILTGVGAVTVKIPKVRSRLGEPVVFRSALVCASLSFDGCGDCVAVLEACFER